MDRSSGKSTFSSLGTAATNGTEVLSFTEGAVQASWKSHIQNPVNCTVNANELTSLTALIAYVAHITGVPEFRVEREFADRFRVPSVVCLPSAEYDHAIRYLVDRAAASA